MSFKVISRNVGYALLVSALFMLVGVIIAASGKGDTSLVPLAVSFLITFISGVFPMIFVRRTPSITLREGYVIIVLSWLLSFVFGMLPYVLWGGPFTVSNAWFESVSGFTTTGATILNDIEALPPGLQFWRCSTHFIGGLGVVVFLLLIIPESSPVRLRLTNMELSTLSKSTYFTRSNRTVYVFAYIYLGICLGAFICYVLAGMPVLDAVCHAFSVCATGGFSTRNLSIGAYNSLWIEGITMLFMFLSSIHFGLLFLAIVTHSLRPLRNPVLRFYLAALVLFTVLDAVAMKAGGVETSLPGALWNGAFQTLCVATTSGFSIVSADAWPPLPEILLFFGVMCACAGSTTGGVKADRILIFFKALGRQISHSLHPSSVHEVRLGGKSLHEEDVYPHMLYLTLYLVLIAVSAVLVIGMGVDHHDAVIASVSAMGDLGPGAFSTMPDGAKVLFSFNMFLGRIEIYPVLAVLAMIFDRRRH
ncbi:MAG: TrkH family potassium uptake protein [Bacteroidales bacterium]|nr:TrkH family potassium uptake protein [Bacteroidales bacterium]